MVNLISMQKFRNHESQLTEVTKKYDRPRRPRRQTYVGNEIPRPRILLGNHLYLDPCLVHVRADEGALYKLTRCFLFFLIMQIYEYDKEVTGKIVSSQSCLSCIFALFFFLSFASIFLFLLYIEYLFLYYTRKERQCIDLFLLFNWKEDIKYKLNRNRNLQNTVALNIKTVLQRSNSI